MAIPYELIFSNIDDVEKSNLRRSKNVSTLTALQRRLLEYCEDREGETHIHIGADEFTSHLFMALCNVSHIRDISTDDLEVMHELAVGIFWDIANAQA